MTRAKVIEDLQNLISKLEDKEDGDLSTWQLDSMEISVNKLYRVLNDKPERRQK